MREPDDPIGSTEAAGGTSVYARWSRRKSLSRAGGMAPRDPAGEPSSEPPGALPAQVTGESPEESPATPPPATQAPPAPTRELTDEDMPPLESLGEDADYSGFMSPGVSEGLRTRALRKLFMSSTFNVVDGLDDYDDDFTRFEALGDLVTADMRHRLEQEARKAADGGQEEEKEEGDTPPPGPDAGMSPEDPSSGAVAQRPADGEATHRRCAREPLPAQDQPAAGEADARLVPDPGPARGPGASE